MNLDAVSLRFLDFDYSEDTEGIGMFDAMASVGSPQLAAVHAEIAAVLAWAFDTFSSRHGPVGEGFEWDYELQGMQEIASPESIEFDPDAQQLRVRPGSPGAPRHTLTLSIGGSPGFCEAFRVRFSLD